MLARCDGIDTAHRGARRARKGADYSAVDRDLAGKCAGQCRTADSLRGQL